MKLLLDTHVWLWHLLAVERLSSKIRRIINDDRSELWLSPISVWEALLLARKGRLKLHPTPEEFVIDSLRNFPTREAALTTEVAIQSERLMLSHNDPADRFLAATANVFELTLVTSDKQLLKSKSVETLKA